MAGGHIKYRALNRSSSARKALLRTLVTNLVIHEHIHTTYAKAKEAQRLAEKLITLAKRNNEPCRRKAYGILYVGFPGHCPRAKEHDKEYRKRSSWLTWIGTAQVH